MGMIDLFQFQPITFLKLETVDGTNRIETEYPTEGVVQLRDGMEQSLNADTPTSDATVWIHPDADYVEDCGGIVVGHGLKIQDQFYRIIGQVTGYDHDLGYVDNLTLDLKRESLWQDESLLPLE